VRSPWHGPSQREREQRATARCGPAGLLGRLDENSLMLPVSARRRPSVCMDARHTPSSAQQRLSVGGLLAHESLSSAAARILASLPCLQLQGLLRGPLRARLQHNSDHNVPEARLRRVQVRGGLRQGLPVWECSCVGCQGRAVGAVSARRALLKRWLPAEPQPVTGEDCAAAAVWRARREGKTGDGSGVRPLDSGAALVGLWHFGRLLIPCSYHVVVALRCSLVRFCLSHPPPPGRLLLLFLSTAQARPRLLRRRGERGCLRHAARLCPQRGAEGRCNAAPQPAHPPA
jgi:hypothetical protein